MEKANTLDESYHNKATHRDNDMEMLNAVSDDDWELLSDTFSVLTVNSSTLADEFVGDEMEAYYDEKLKRWVFPDDCPPDALVPPPLAPDKAEAPDKSEPALASDDPLAALMAPPPNRSIPSRTISAPVHVSPPTPAGKASGVPASPAMDQAPPAFTVFQKKTARLELANGKRDCEIDDQCKHA